MDHRRFYSLMRNNINQPSNLGGKEELSPAEGNGAPGSLPAAEAKEEGGRMTGLC